MSEDALRQEPFASGGARAPTGGAGGETSRADPGPTANPGPEGMDDDGSGAAVPRAPEPTGSGDGAVAAAGGDAPADLDGLPQARSRRKGRRLVAPDDRPALTAEQRLLLLDTWQRSGLSAGDFAALVGMSRHTLYLWKKKFAQYGPEGLLDRARGGPRGSRLPDLTKRAILLLKKGHPDWGCQRISDMLLRGPALPASPTAVARVLKEAGYVLEDVPTTPHAPKVVRFERSRPNELWQTDIFTFTLRRQNRRVYLVAFLDDYSRYVTGWGLHATASTALVIDVLRAAIVSYGPPVAVLSDNGPQYVTWRGKSAFSRELEARGIRHIVARPRRPQTLGKVERFWGTLWRECLERALFADLGDAILRVGCFVDHYNLQRPHQGLDGLVPADRYFGADSPVRRAIEERVAKNALEIARDGLPREPFYLAGNVGGKGFSVHAEGERVILLPEDGSRREIELVGPGDAGAATGKASVADGPKAETRKEDNDERSRRDEGIGSGRVEPVDGGRP